MVCSSFILIDSPWSPKLSSDSFRHRRIDHRFTTVAFPAQAEQGSWSLSIRHALAFLSQTLPS
jgi:hypothetical protein